MENFPFFRSSNILQEMYSFTIGNVFILLPMVFVAYVSKWLN